MQIKTFPIGFIIKRPRCRARVSLPVGGRRSSISCFSPSSRRRMREYLVSHEIPRYVRVGITLTLPWSVPDWSLVMDDFRTVMHRFRTYWRRRFPDSSAVYRVELQKRGAPHVHLVSYHKPEDIPLFHDDYFSLWFKSLGSLHDYSYDDFALHGVLVEPVADVTAMFHYLSDHATKKKQAQLGYKGKQWGVLGKENLSLVEHSIISVPDDVEYSIVRTLRKLNRYKVHAQCPFGYRYVKVRRLRSVSFFSSDVLVRLVRSLC